MTGRMRLSTLTSVWPMLVVLLPVALTSAGDLTEIGSIPAAHAGFVAIADTGRGGARSDQFTVLISGFNPIPLLHDSVYQVNNAGSTLGARTDHNVTLRSHEISRQISWPNEINQIPDSALHKPGLVTVAGGFLVPTKDHGSITIMDLTSDPPTSHLITTGQGDASWFYHRVEWRDMNGDGLQDMVTCRAQKHIIGDAKGQLVWFEHPQGDALAQGWPVHVITDGPDVMFRVTSLPTPQGNMDVIITAGFFSETLNVYWTTHPQGRWDDASEIQHRVIDDGIGHVFDVEVIDLDGDGKVELMVTNNAHSHASLFAFTVPSDFRTGAFSRHTLATDFTSRQHGPGNGAPGSALPVFPRADSTHGKPWIVVSGDDDGRAYLLKPDSNAVGDWSYSQSVILDVGGSTVGGIAAGDVDGDGYNEVFVPAFSQGRVHIFTFKPQTGSAPIG